MKRREAPVPVNVKSTSSAPRRSQLPNVASFYALFLIVGTPSNSRQLGSHSAAAYLASRSFFLFTLS